MKKFNLFFVALAIFVGSIASSSFAGRHWELMVLTEMETGAPLVKIKYNHNFGVDDSKPDWKNYVVSLTGAKDDFTHDNEARESTRYIVGSAVLVGQDSKPFDLLEIRYEAGTVNYSRNHTLVKKENSFLLDVFYLRGDKSKFTLDQEVIKIDECSAPKYRYLDTQDYSEQWEPYQSDRWFKVRVLKVAEVEVYTVPSLVFGESFPYEHRTGSYKFYDYTGHDPVDKKPKGGQVDNSKRIKFDPRRKLYDQKL